MRWSRDDDGQGLVESALVIAVVAVAIVVVPAFVSGNLQNLFSNIGNKVT